MRTSYLSFDFHGLSDTLPLKSIKIDGHVGPSSNRPHVPPKMPQVHLMRPSPDPQSEIYLLNMFQSRWTARWGDHPGRTLSYTHPRSYYVRTRTRADPEERRRDSPRRLRRCSTGRRSHDARIGEASCVLHQDGAEAVPGC